MGNRLDYGGILALRQGGGGESGETENEKMRKSVEKMRKNAEKCGEKKR